MEIQDNTREQIKQVLQSPQWKAITYIAEQYIVFLQAQPRAKDTPDQTLQNTLIIEGQIKGVEGFIRELYSSV